MLQSHEWQQLRHRKLESVRGLCERCLSQKLYVPATEIHHIVPVETATTIEDMRQLCFGWNNLQAVCHDCHQQEHRELRSRSKAQIAERNKAKTNRFIVQFFGSSRAADNRGDVFFIEAPSHPNPMPKCRKKFLVSENSLGGEAAQLSKV